MNETRDGVVMTLKETTPKLTFKQLKPGEFFTYSVGRSIDDVLILQKIEPTGTSQGGNDKVWWNTLKVSDGSVFFTENNEEVFKLKGELNFEYE